MYHTINNISALFLLFKVIALKCVFADKIFFKWTYSIKSLVLRK